MQHVEALAAPTLVVRAERASQTSAFSLTRLLLLCGATAGPLFILTVLIQDYTRVDFDPRTHMLSLLALGDWGWVQVANFAGAGVLNVLYAVGLWRTLRTGRAGTAAAILIAAYGLGLVTVGIFTTDPAGGFPPGSVEPAGPSGHGIVHALGALFVFLFRAAAIASLGRYFLSHGERGSGSYCIASAVVIMLLFFGGINNAEFMARLIRLATFIGWLAPALCAVKLLSSRTELHRARTEQPGTQEVGIPAELTTRALG